MIAKLLPLMGSAMLLASCGSSYSSSSSPTSVTSGGAVKVGSTISSINSKYGEVLASGSGRAYYMFVPDTSTKSSCYNVCATIWPPVVESGSTLPSVAGGVNKSLLGTLTRTDGSKQLTYNGHPLYTYKPDGSDTTYGQGIDHFGGYWYLVTPSGQVVRSAGSTTTTAASSSGSGGAY